MSDDYPTPEEIIARLRFASELALVLLEGDSADLHMSGFHSGHRLNKAQMPTVVQRGRLAAVVLERGRRAGR